MSNQTMQAPSPNGGIQWQEFPSFLAHEVRGPLAVILGNALLLQRYGSHDDQTRSGLEDIREEAEKLRRIIEGLLSLFGAHYEPDPLPTRIVVETVVERFRKHHPTRSLKLAFKTDSFVIGVHSYIEEILENLVSNADKYSPPGESIDVEVFDRGSHVTVRVEDRASGIGPGDEERIFDLFVRLDESAAIPGHGIGLALSRRLAEAMDGELTYEARPKGGSRFSLTLPAEDALVLPSLQPEMTAA